MAKYFDGDASGEMTISETSDRLVEAIRSLAGGYLARCVPIDISQVVRQLARLPLTAVYDTRLFSAGHAERASKFRGKGIKFGDYVQFLIYF